MVQMLNILLYTAVILIYGSSWIMIPYQMGIVPVEASVAYRLIIAAFFYSFRQRCRKGVVAGVWLDNLLCAGQHGVLTQSGSGPVDDRQYGMGNGVRCSASICFSETQRQPLHLRSDMPYTASLVYLTLLGNFFVLMQPREIKASGQ
jgi:hypothetical protein